MKITLSNPHGNDKPVSIQYAILLVSFHHQNWILFATDLQPGESKQKQHNSCSAEGFLPGPILPHELWVKPYPGISPRSNEITKSEHSWHNPVHVFTSEILNFGDCGDHELSFNLYKM